MKTPAVHRPLPFVLIVAALLMLCAIAGHADEAVTAAPGNESVVISAVDWLAQFIPTKWIGVIWTLVTTLGVLASAIAGLIRLFAPASRAAEIVDIVAHWASLIGTSAKPQQIAAPASPVVVVTPAK